MFYDRLKQVCTSQGKSPSSVVQAIGMSKANVTGWKNGASPKILTVARLARELNVPIAELIDEDDQESEVTT